MEDGQYVENSIWFYAPNKGAPDFFIVAFLAGGAAHFWQALHYKCWRLTGLYVFCPLLFVLGFVTRVLGAFDYGNLVKYIISICSTYAAPPLYELGNYYVLGRILYFVPYYSPIHPGRVLTTFSAISIVVESISGVGASYVANQSLPKEMQETGRSLLQAALIIQLVVVSLFLLLASAFHVRCRRNGVNHDKFNQALITLYMSEVIILVRCIYRTVEYFGISRADFDSPTFDSASVSPVIRYEWFFYVFEATLMLCNSVLLNVRHPRRWLPKSTKVYLSKDGTTEIEGPGYKEDRKYVMTVLDPFDIIGVVKRRDKSTRFWDLDGPGSAKTNDGGEMPTGLLQSRGAV
ncbi:Uu.00g138440.m01.CDS01 [Anthostomella pinea]|uniref:Uu.00g138440.m01.CDS01 n=1 Tax=Anthostomella pinea TaxID=933095 RepID=A0AAI8VQM2_9PEZI|nr:Uu.00g138440.m01.CDS01 [Anthostomella pinea]